MKRSKTRSKLNAERRSDMHTLRLPLGLFKEKDIRTLKRLKINQTKRSWKDFSEKDWKRIVVYLND